MSIKEYLINAISKWEKLCQKPSACLFLDLRIYFDTDGPAWFISLCVAFVDLY